MSRAKCHNHATLLEEFLKRQTFLPTHNGLVNVSQVAKDAGFKYRTPIYDNDACFKLLCDACRRLGYPPPERGVRTSESAPATAYSQKELSEKNAKIKKLEERLVVEQNTSKELAQQVKELEQRIQSMEKGIFVQEILLDTGRLARSPINKVL